MEGDVWHALVHTDRRNDPTFVDTSAVLICMGAFLFLLYDLS